MDGAFRKKRDTNFFIDVGARTQESPMAVFQAFTIHWYVHTIEEKAE